MTRMTSLLTLAGLLLAASLAAASLVPAGPALPSDIINYLALTEKKKADATVCIDINFNHCQANLNIALGLDPNLYSWRNGTDIANAIAGILEGDNVNAVLALCNARALFQQCLGAQFFSCTSYANLLTKPNADLVEVYNYVNSIYKLHFLCDAGFEEAVNDYLCLHTVSKTKPYLDCMTEFLIEVANDPNRLCRAVQRNAGCLNMVYFQGCPNVDANSAGWWGCELFRSSYEQACYEIPRCFVHH